MSRNGIMEDDMDIGSRVQVKDLGTVQQSNMQGAVEDTRHADAGKLGTVVGEVRVELKGVRILTVKVDGEPDLLNFREEHLDEVRR